MKKTYIKPEMEIEALELENMIALSANIFGGDAAKTGGDDDGDVMEGKQRSIWDWDVNYWNGKTN